MLVADVCRGVTLIAGILFVAAISYDRYIHIDVDTDSTKLDFYVGAYKFSTKNWPSPETKPQTSCTSALSYGSQSRPISQACENSCKSKKTFTVMLAILPFVALAASSLMSNPLMSTSNRLMVIISALITQFTALLSVVLIMIFVVEMRVYPLTMGNFMCGTWAGDANVPQQHPNYVYTSLILTMIGGALCAISGTMQLVMPSVQVSTANHMLYNNMLYNRMSGHM